MGDKAKKTKSDKPKRHKKAKQSAAGAANGSGVIEELREAGARLIAAANSPAGREAIAVGLSIAATAAQAAVTASRAKGKAAEGEKAAPVGQEALTAALGGVAETVLARLFPAKKG